ncbi:uncharacterized protein LOC143034020 isoform X1 [Oratosquilla oratoria]|uniref:uncharacterized protein LOC143034020 isoform X1 n=1 Tax=Oratosquilla oratoria TaxID=337810 RepID=UPI003F775701
MDCGWQCHFIIIFIIFIQGLFLSSEAKLYEITADENGDLSSQVPIKALNVVNNFYLWTREHDKKHEKLFPSSVQLSSFKRRQTYVIIHGFLGNGLESWITTLKDHMLMREDCNVISVDWPAGTEAFLPSYYIAVDRVPYVGEELANLMKSLIHTKNFTVDLLHMVGHSLGGHIAGYTGKHFHGNTSRITGLDPAGLMFHNTVPSKRLDKSDAKYVDVMHTNGCTTAWVWTNCFGINEDLGHTDFWPNGGQIQPGCSAISKKNKTKLKGDIGCSHEMAYKFYTESWKYGNEKTLFLARPCETWDVYKSGHCSCSEQAQYMGYNTDRLEGRYFLKTGKQYPFAREDANCVPGTNGVSKNFFLWTRKTAGDSQHEQLNPFNDTSIMNSHLVNRKTYVIIHGFVSHGLEKWVLTLKNKLLMREDCNVISVDWPAGTSWFQPSYDWIIDLLPEVGQELSSLLRVLWKAKDLSLTNVHFIGHSLGAHIAGFSGKSFGGQVRRITALDPAGPRFRNVSSHLRLDKEDAQFVDVIHTNACPNISNWTACVGLNESIGHADYWPNGGEHQERCAKAILQSNDSSQEEIGCSHNMAYVYYMESLEYMEENTLFLARPCTRWDEYNSGECACSEKAPYMGYNVNTRMKGNYYLNTSDSAPYARQDGDCRPGTDGVYKHFYLWTRETSRDLEREELKPHDKNTLVSSHFANRTTYVIIHGFMGNGLEKWIVSLKDKLLMREDCNVISVDWPAGTSLFELSYTYTTGLLPKVGYDSATLISNLSEISGLKLSSIHVIGHSLGAHIAGFAGKILSGQVGRITGLDPAGPGFNNVTSNRRLDKEDAQYVDVVHTNACEMDSFSKNCHGLNENIGHSDFWPNGGSHQPSCQGDNLFIKNFTSGILGCESEMAYVYFIESFIYDNDDTFYLARPCTTWEEYQSEKCPCDNNKAQYLGYNINTRAIGTFYLDTATTFPFAVQDKKCPPGADGIYKHFFLWTRDTPANNHYECLSLSNNDTIIFSNFKDRKTYMIIHGFTSDGLEPWIMELKDKLLMREDCNVISLDWPAGSLFGPAYTAVVLRVPKVGREASRVLRLLSDLKGLKWSETHLIGHSLGAHVAGFAGKESDGKLGRITGLDPAGPLYENVMPKKRLDKGDAKFVDIIHTNACPFTGLTSGCYGLNQSIGHSDIWPNGGADQPACTEMSLIGLRAVCDHEMAYTYFAESIIYDEVETLYLARPCSSWVEYNSGSCSCSEKAQYMGYNINSSLNGNFYLSTSDNYPYAKKDKECPPGAKETTHNFFLWTRSTKKDDQHEHLKPYDRKSISSSHFRNGKTYIIIHGFTGNGTSRPIKRIKDNLLGKEDCNVISVDWPAGSTLYLPSYGWTSTLLPRIGNDTVALINALMKIKKLTVGEIHIIGHGLGAHIAGLVGKEFKGTIAQITGLDPAGPGFNDVDRKSRLDKEDAVYVDVIHTSGCSYNTTWSECLGINKSIGMSDFWPNGGEAQPSCSGLWTESSEAYDKCNHEIALSYYGESILYKIDTTYFLARSCGSWEEYDEGNCSCGESAQYMGYNVNIRVKGSFFIFTNSESPFALQDAACLPGYTGNTNVIIASSVGGSVGVIGFAALGVLIFKRLRRNEGSGLEISEPLIHDAAEPIEP